MATNDKPLRNVLVMRLSVLGNVAMTIPVLYPVCKANPDTRFIMLTKMTVPPTSRWWTLTSRSITEACSGC